MSGNNNNSIKPMLYFLLAKQKRIPMPRKPRIEIAGYYHVINRGVDQRVIFKEAVKPGNQGSGDR